MATGDNGRTSVAPLLLTTKGARKMRAGVLSEGGRQLGKRGGEENDPTLSRIFRLLSLRPRVVLLVSLDFPLACCDW